MKYSTKLLYTLVFAGISFTCAAEPTPKETTAQEEPDTLTYAAGHGVGAILYDSAATLAQVATLLVPYMVIGNEQMTRGREIAYGVANGAVFAASIWGRYKLPEWIDRYMFHKQTERSKSHKILSCTIRSIFGWPAAVVESAIESERAKRKKLATSAHN